MIYRSGYKGVGMASKIRLTIIIKEVDAKGLTYRASKSMSYTLDERPDLLNMARRVDEAVMGGNFDGE